MDVEENTDIETPIVNSPKKGLKRTISKTSDDVSEITMDSALENVACPHCQHCQHCSGTRLVRVQVQSIASFPTVQTNCF